MDDGRAMPAWVKRAIVWFWLGGLAVFYLVGMVRSLRTLLMLLLVSLFLAFALEPAVNGLERRGVRRGVGTAIAFVAVALLVGTFSAVVGAALAREVDFLIDNAPGYIEDLQAWLNDTFGLEYDFATVRVEFLEGGGLENLASRFADDVVNVGATVVTLLFDLFAVALFTFYLVAEGPKLRRLVGSLLSERHAAMIYEIWELAMDKTGAYIYSRTLLAVLSATVHWATFELLGVPSPLALGMWVGVISQFIPAVGTYIAGALPVAVSLLHDPRTGLWALIVILVYQQIENYLLAPSITAHTMHIHVALAFGAVIAGAALLGIVGALLALPFAATAQAFISGWIARHQTAPAPPAGPLDTDPPPEAPNEA